MSLSVLPGATKVMRLSRRPRRTSKPLRSVLDRALVWPWRPGQHRPNRYFSEPREPASRHNRRQAPATSRLNREVFRLPGSSPGLR